ncbi:MAG: electron transfer flavoprotein subunit beta/FixA family protein [Alphaproteobacteria bacterium]|jgi:electron transfer flavoprotein beta subunit|uniref:Electron transfer flavoprotein alpha/beta-subunit N-terminal domain-containing protein n=1 Tax=marine metagenome TaxID=408172 RepID=A0A381SYK1_9ZZZZ|nr:electron transfer flavoprotein subunit beta/FixA family protein [Alphaproteobacteria bacterium]|tara:strand:+ start:2725 stop:3474 length:750 start_codon:yes stop_codon:yes gene_type:complete
MKILVAVKRVIDYNVQIRVKSDSTGVETENVKMSMNPPDENAVEEALRIKESGVAEEVIAVSIGEDKAKETIRTALAMGVDRGIHVKGVHDVEPLAVAKILQKIVEKEKPQIVLLGKQAIDDDSNQTGQMLSALLGWTQGTFASKIELEASAAIITREIDEGLEKVKLSFPIVATCDLRLNEPRYASLPNIMKAKKKPIDDYTSDELGIDVSPRIKQLKVTEPPKREKGIMVANVAELVHKLKHEAKAI